MSWFSRAKKDGVVTKRKPNLEWKVKREDFLSDSLEGYADPHLGAIYLEMLRLIPEGWRGNVVMAGGFAAHIAGITKMHKDIDLFCDHPYVFDTMFERYEQDPTITQLADLLDRENYGRLAKFEKDGQKFDLVDVYPAVYPTLPGPTGEETEKYPDLDVIDVLSSFDINWAMAGITTTEDEPRIFIHPEALSGDVRVNVNCVKVLEGTQARIEKYMERLVRHVDAPYARQVIKALGIHMANSQAAEDSDWDS